MTLKNTYVAMETVSEEVTVVKEVKAVWIKVKGKQGRVKSSEEEGSEIIAA